MHPTTNCNCSVHSISPSLSSSSQSHFAVNYTVCCCSEENVYKLCETYKESGLDTVNDCFAVLISNPSKTVAMWQQRKGDPKQESIVVWDYHVILIARQSPSTSPTPSPTPSSSTSSTSPTSLSSTSSWLVYDLDTRLPFPCDLSVYIAKAFPPAYRAWAKSRGFEAFFRVASAAVYLEHFASDRSHMMGKDGEWFASPPSYPPIVSATSKNNIHDWWTMTMTTKPTTTEPTTTASSSSSSETGNSSSVEDLRTAAKRDSLGVVVPSVSTLLTMFLEETHR